MPFYLYNAKSVFLGITYIVIFFSVGWNRNITINKSMTIGQGYPSNGFVNRNYYAIDSE